MTKHGTKKSIPVVLEKAEARVLETAPKPVLQVDPEVLSSLKNQSQLADQAQLEELEREKQEKRDYYRNKALFYVGVFGGVAIMYLVFNYTKTKPDAKYLPELLNATKEVVPLVLPK